MSRWTILSYVLKIKEDESLLHKRLIIDSETTRLLDYTHTLINTTHTHRIRRVRTIKTMRSEFQLSTGRMINIIYL